MMKDLDLSHGPHWGKMAVPFVTKDPDSSIVTLYTSQVDTMQPCNITPNSSSKTGVRD